MQPKTRLHVKSLRSVGFVDVGACEGADIILAKRKDVAPVDIATLGVALALKSADKWASGAQTFAELIDADEARAILGRAQDTLYQSLWSIMGDGDLSNIQRVDKMRESVAGFLAAVEAKLTESSMKAGRKMSAERLTKLRDVVSQLSTLLADVDDDAASKKEPPMAKFDPASLPEEARKHIEGIEEAARKRVADLEAEVTTLKAATADPEAEALKALPAEVRKRLEDAEKRAEEAVTAAKAERDARMTAECVQKAAPIAAKLPIKADALGGIMKRLVDGEATKDDAAEIERVLKAAAEAVKTLTIVGDDGGSADVATKIQAAADEIRKQDPKLTPAQARVEARKRNPDLAAAERAERAA